jgi:23S rRNA pseudouridine2605 synthase
VSEQGERLQKVLARAGVGSRRAVESLIEQGRVTVNGKVARLGQRVDLSKGVVEVDGSRVHLAANLAYYLMNKPPGVVTTARDPKAGTTVLDLLDVPSRVWPVGRLDIETEGALLLTNDGELTFRLTHPRFEVPKTYVAEVQGSLASAARRTLMKGVRLEEGLTAPASVREVGRFGGRTQIEITITEGRNRQVRRMLEAVGHPVGRLVRIQIGPLRLGRLKPGTARKLSFEEVRALYRAVGL